MEFNWHCEDEKSDLFLMLDQKERRVLDYAARRVLGAAACGDIEPLTEIDADLLLEYIALNAKTKANASEKVSIITYRDGLDVYTKALGTFCVLQDMEAPSDSMISAAKSMATDIQVELAARSLPDFIPVEFTE